MSSHSPSTTYLKDCASSWQRRRRRQGNNISQGGCCCSPTWAIYTSHFPYHPQFPVRISPATPMRCEKFHESPPGGSLEGKGAFHQDTFSPPLPDTHPQRKRTIPGRDDSDCWWSFRGGGLLVGSSRACVSYSCQVFNVKTRHRDQPTQTDEKKLWGWWSPSPPLVRESYSTTPRDFTHLFMRLFPLSLQSLSSLRGGEERNFTKLPH